MTGWNTIVSFWGNLGLFSGVNLLLVSGSVWELVFGDLLLCEFFCWRVLFFFGVHASRRIRSISSRSLSEKGSVWALHKNNQTIIFQSHFFAGVRLVYRSCFHFCWFYHLFVLPNNPFGSSHNPCGSSDTSLFSSLKQMRGWQFDHHSCSSFMIRSTYLYVCFKEASSEFQVCTVYI